MDAIGAEELVAFVTAKVKIGVEEVVTGVTEISGVTDGVIEGSLVLEGDWIAGVSTWLVSGVTILDGGGAWKSGAKGAVLVLDEDF